jgi:7-cyano-7-deazaguanine reductase
MAKKRLQLGRPTPIPASPDKAVLDRVSNPQPDTDYVARFTAPEFTTLCPITGQPDFMKTARLPSASVFMHC